MNPLPQLDALVHDVLAFAERGAGFWRIQDLRLPALESIATAAGDLVRPDDHNERFNAVESVLLGAIADLPQPWQDVAADHLGFSDRTRSLSSQTARGNLASQHIYMDGRTYRRAVLRDGRYPSWKLKTITLVALASIDRLEAPRDLSSAGITSDLTSDGSGERTDSPVLPVQTPLPERPQRTREPRVSIFCAVPVEHAVIRRFCRTLAWDSEYGFERGVLVAAHTEWQVSVYCTGQTNSAAAAATASVLSSFRPTLAIFVGMAGGFAEKDVQHLDLVVGSAVHLYQSGAAHAEDLKSRPRSRTSDQTLLDLVGVVAQDGSLGPQAIHIGDIVSGDQLLKSLASNTYQLIRQHYDQALAVDMEGHGFLEAAARLRVPALVVRGISDLVEDKRAGTDATRQPAATHRAMRLAIKLLEHYTPGLPRSESDLAAPAETDTQRDVQAVHLAAVLLPHQGGAAAFNEPGFAPVRQLALRVIAGEWASLGATALGFVENRFVQAMFPQITSAVEGAISSSGSLAGAQWPNHMTAGVAFGLASTRSRALTMASSGSPNRLVAENLFRADLALLGFGEVTESGQGSVSVLVPIADIGDPPREAVTDPLQPRRKDREAPEADGALDADPLAREFWSVAPHLTTLVIVAPDTRRQESANRHADYSELNFVGDKDSVLRGCVHIARLFPHVDIAVYPSSWLPDSSRTAPLLVVGGPIGEDGRGGNRLAGEIIEHYGLPVSYDLTNDPPCLRWDSSEFSTEYDEFGQISRDGAFVARLPNPWNPDVDIVLAQGTHTYGGLGALKAFTDRSVASHNVEMARASVSQGLHFAAVFRVKVAGGVLLPPRLDSEDVFPFGYVAT